MKTFSHVWSGTSFNHRRVIRYAVLAILAFTGLETMMLQAQTPNLSVQGILKKANGEAVPDDIYTLTFKLYTTATGGSPVWTEMQSNVEVISGIYSTVLGNSTALNIPFNQIYYLGVSVGSTEMTPRIQMTSAPYALSLIGTTNFFPSSGVVVADSIRVNGGVLARGGAPGANGVSKNGYAFTGNNGDKDSGLFSNGNGQVSLYVNNVEEVRATPDSVVINGEARVENLRLDNGGTISYNGKTDWRLVETDYFENTGDSEGWKIYNPTIGVAGAWSNGSGSTASVTSFTDDFAGRALVPTSQGQVFKKNFTLPGSSVAGTYTHIKVVFNYYYLNTWDFSEVDKGWAAFSKTESCTELSVGWFSHDDYVSQAWNLGNNAGQFGPAANFVNGAAGGGGVQWSDQWTTQEMVARYPSGPGNSNFWVIFGHASNESVDAENFGVGMIEIWVK